MSRVTFGCHNWGRGAGIEWGEARADRTHAQDKTQQAPLAGVLRSRDPGRQSFAGAGLTPKTPSVSDPFMIWGIHTQLLK